MSLADVAALALVLGLAAYLVLAGADFGAGFWDLEARGRSAARVRALLERSMGPVWEANHVWLIFVLVVFWTAFPRPFAAVASTLYVPLSGAAVGIILRGSAFAFRGAAEGTPAERPLRVLFALSSVLTPFFLGAAIGGLASGRVPLGNAEGEAIASWWNATGVAVGGITVVNGIYLAAVYAAADADRAGLDDLAAWFRRRALVTGLVAGVAALGGLLVVRRDAPDLSDALLGDGLPLVLVSAAGGLATLSLVWRHRLGPARLTAAAASGAVVGAWALAQHPALLPGQVTVEEGAAGRPTLVALLVGAAIGTAVLVPALAWLFRLTLAGRLGKQLGPPTDEGQGSPT